MLNRFVGLNDNLKAREPSVEPRGITARKTRRKRTVPCDSNWISDDSEENSEKHEELLNQYLDNGMRENVKTQRNVKQKRPAFIEEDSIDMGNGDERCFVCSKIIHGVSEYADHVNACLEKAQKQTGNI